MTKKIITLFLIILLAVCSISVLANESSVVIEKYSFSNSTRFLTVSGTVKTGQNKGVVPLVFTVSNENGDILYAEDGYSSSVDENGISDFEFKTYRIPKKFSSSAYTLSIYAEFVNKSAQKTFNYISELQWHTILSNLNSNKLTNNVDANIGIITTNINYLDIDAELYSNMKKEQKELIAKTVMKTQYNIPSTYSGTDEEIAQVNDAVGELKKRCAEGEMYAKLYVATDEASFSEWYNEYSTELSLFSENSNTIVTEENFKNEYFNSAIKKQEFLKRVPNVALKIDKDNMTLDLMKETILATVETSNTTVTQKICEDCYDIIGLTSLSGDSDIKNLVFSNISTLSYENCALLLADINKWMNYYLTPPTLPGGNNNGATGGGGSSFSGNSGIIATEIIRNEPELEIPFTDIQGYDWAKDAIEFLYKRSIISGRSETVFDPGGYVTRAEFVKMLVGTYNYSYPAGEIKKFDDIEDTAWYTDYIYKAVANGIVNGDNKNCFNPNFTLTREDMAVMVYRASKFPEKEIYVTFSDMPQISDYAVTAVKNLAENNVVSGIGNNTFAPKEKVTRAQAAQILYNVLINTIK